MILRCAIKNLITNCRDFVVGLYMICALSLVIVIFIGYAIVGSIAYPLMSEKQKLKFKYWMDRGLL